jgi:hypothetical protein
VGGGGGGKAQQGRIHVVQRSMVAASENVDEHSDSLRLMSDHTCSTFDQLGMWLYTAPSRCTP